MNKINHSKDLAKLLDFSILVSSITLMLIFFPIAHISIEFFPDSFVDIFSYVYFIQIISFFVLACILVRFGLIEFIKIKLPIFFKKNEDKKKIMDSFKKKHIILIFFLFFVISLVILCEILYGNNFGEWAFARERVERSFTDANPINYLKTIIEGDLKNNSTPSGFVLRQWIILLFSLYILNRNRIKKGITGEYFSKLSTKLFKLFFYISFALVSLGRLILRQHTLVDIIVAISLGTIIYFFVVFVIARIFKKNIGRSLLNRFTIFCIYSFSIFIIISKNPITFLYIGVLFIFIVIPLLYLISKDDWGKEAWV